MQASSLQKRRVTGAHAFFLGAFLALLALTPAILPEFEAEPQSLLFNKSFSGFFSPLATTTS